MEYVHTELRGRKVILLSGARTDKKQSRIPVTIEALDGLLDAAQANPDAVAFGYVRGKWVAAA